jgi:hypothetical protein
MNPFLIFKKTRNSFGVVILAYSYPPGTKPMFYPFSISFFIFSLLTVLHPHNLKIRPKKGALKPNLLPKAVNLGIYPFGLFIFNKIAELFKCYHRRKYREDESKTCIFLFPLFFINVLL